MLAEDITRKSSDLSRETNMKPNAGTFKYLVPWWKTI